MEEQIQVTIEEANTETMCPETMYPVMEEAVKEEVEEKMTEEEIFGSTPVLEEIFENKYGEQFKPEYAETESTLVLEEPKPVQKKSNIRELIDQLHRLDGEIDQIREILDYMENQGLTIVEVFNMITAKLDERTEVRDKILSAEVDL